MTMTFQLVYLLYVRILDKYTRYGKDIKLKHVYNKDDVSELVCYFVFGTKNIGHRRKFNGKDKVGNKGNEEIFSL